MLSSVLRWILVSVVAALMTACGGGGGDAGCSPIDGCSGGGGSGSGSTLSVSLTLSDRTVTAAAPVTVTAKVISSNSPVANAVVHFTVDGDLGFLSANSGLTNSNGETSVVLTPAVTTVGGADVVRASVTVGTETASASENFALTSTEAEVISVMPASGNGDAELSPVAAYGQTDVTVTLAGVSEQTPATVTLTSGCVSQGKASFSPASVRTASNTFSVRYTDLGCGAGQKVDTITASLAGAGVSVQGSIYLTSPAPSSVVFVSASPSVIYLKGSGQVEASTVVFQVNDLSGKPLQGQRVYMELTTGVGGVTLDLQGYGVKVPKTTDVNGQVQAIVNSGTVPTPVRVIASLSESGGGVQTVSSQLAVGVGLPSQVNFSLAQKAPNIECFDIDGATNFYTIYAADRSGNPVPRGTAISFVADEGGQIQSNIQTDLSEAGIASGTASFVCQEPRPADGRVTITAYAVGEESFFDMNGDNVYTEGEPFQDLGNVVKDAWFDNIFDPDLDEFVTLGTSGGTVCDTSFAAKYPKFKLRAEIPSRPGTCDGVWSPRTYVRRAVETVMSTSAAGLAWISNDALPSGCSIQMVSSAPDGGKKVKSYPIERNGTVYVEGQTGAVSFYIADANKTRWNPLAKGTTLGYGSVSKGLTVNVMGTPVPETSTVTHGALTYEFGDDTTSGSLTLNAKSPSGVTTEYRVNIVRIKKTIRSADPDIGLCTK